MRVADHALKTPVSIQCPAIPDMVYRLVVVRFGTGLGVKNAKLAIVNDHGEETTVHYTDRSARLEAKYSDAMQDVSHVLLQNQTYQTVFARDFEDLYDVVDLASKEVCSTDRLANARPLVLVLLTSAAAVT